MDININAVESFLDWLSVQPHDYMGGEFLYDVKGHYKRLKQGEMWTYWLAHIYKPQS
jgi:hypothetical protein